MEFGVVIGTLVATIKDPALLGVLLLVVQPVDEWGRPRGAPLIVADPDRNAGLGDIVLFVHSPDASMAFPGDLWAPVDAAVVGIVDHATVEQTVSLGTGLAVDLNRRVQAWNLAG